MDVSLKFQTELFLKKLEQNNVKVNRIEKSICDEPVFKQICNFFIRFHFTLKIINANCVIVYYRSFNNHDASEDIDNDGHSVIEVILLHLK